MVVNRYCCRPKTEYGWPVYDRLTGMSQHYDFRSQARDACAAANGKIPLAAHVVLDQLAT